MEEQQAKPLSLLNEAYDMGKEIIRDNKFGTRDAISWLRLASRAFGLIYDDEAPIRKSTRSLIITARKDFREKEFLKVFKFVDKLYRNINTLTNETAISSSGETGSKNIFIIHGHDEVNLLRLDKMLKDDFNLNPVLMQNKPGLNKYLIDKFEELAGQCDFAISLFTKDDLITNHEQHYFQARPNVIFEFGWFLAASSRQNLLLILEEGVKLHSDYDGVSRVQFKDNIRNAYADIQTELIGLGVI